MNYTQDDLNNEKEWTRRMKEEFAKAKQGIGETNKEFAELMKLLNQSTTKQIKEYMKITEIFKNELNFNELEELTQSGKNKEQRRIQDKYDYLRNEMLWDSDIPNAQKQYYINEYDKMEMQESEKAYQDSPIGEIGEVMSSSFSKGLQEMIKGYKDFSDVTRDITNNMTNYIVKKMSESISNAIFSEQNMNILTGLLGGAFNWGGGVLGSAGGFLKGIFKHHSGGIVSTGANAELPGTQEQLALLKGGERILSPSENTNYNSQGGGSPVVFNNFNVKAWDSKDVSKYLLENRTLLNQITYQGIKDNDSQLRMMVRNA